MNKNPINDEVKKRSLKKQKEKSINEIKNNNGTSIVLSISQLEKVLKGTGVSKKHFINKLNFIKTEEGKQEFLGKKDD